MVLLFCKDSGQGFGLSTWLSILCGEKQCGARVYIDFCSEYLSCSEVKFESARLDTSRQSPRKSNIDNPKKMRKMCFTCHHPLENIHGRTGLNFQADELIQSVGMKQPLSSGTPVNRLVLMAEMEAIHGFTKADVATTTDECPTFQQQKTWDCVIFNRDQQVGKLTDWTTFILTRPAMYYWDWQWFRFAFACLPCLGQCHYPRPHRISDLAMWNPLWHCLDPLYSKGDGVGSTWLWQS